MQCVWFYFPDCNQFADHLQARYGPPVVQGPHVKKPYPRIPILPSLMWLKHHSMLRCLQGFNHFLSPDESPGLCHVLEKAGLSFSCVGGQGARLSAALVIPLEPPPSLLHANATFRSLGPALSVLKSLLAINTWGICEVGKQGFDECGKKKGVTTYE